VAIELWVMQFWSETILGGRGGGGSSQGGPIPQPLNIFLRKSDPFRFPPVPLGDKGDYSIKSNL